MSTSETKIGDILGYLSNQLQQAWIMTMVAKHLDRAWRQGKITRSCWFFQAARIACTESAILTFSRLTIDHRDSIHIGYLLNCCRQNPGVFRHANPTLVSEALEKHKRQLEDMEPLVEAVKTPRDQSIAHLDRRYVNNPDAVFSAPPIDMRKLEQALTVLLSIVNTYKGFLDSSELRLESLEARVAEDLAHLLAL